MTAICLMFVSMCFVFVELLPATKLSPGGSKDKSRAATGTRRRLWSCFTSTLIFLRGESPCIRWNYDRILEKRPERPLSSGNGYTCQDGTESVACQLLNTENDDSPKVNPGGFVP